MVDIGNYCDDIAVYCYCPNYSMKTSCSYLSFFALWMLYAMTGGINCGFNLLNNKVTNFIGGISMEIYLCHMVMFRIIEKLHIERFIDNPYLLFWGWCILGLALTIAFCYMVKYKVFPFVGERIPILSFLK